MSPRISTVDDAEVVAALLDAFNREFDTASPGAAVLTERLREHLAGSAMFAVLDGDPPIAIALVSVRPNVWYDGPAALLDELYVVPAQRNRGIGTDLLAAVEAEVQCRGCGILEINVDGQDVDAQRFYARHGYTATEPGQTEPSLYYFKEFQSPHA